METHENDLKKFDRNIKFLIAFFLVLVIVCTAFFVTSVTALNLTFADSTLTGNHSIDVIRADGSLLNTSYSGDSVYIALADPSNETIIVHYLPASSGGNKFLDRFTSTLDTPDLMLEDIMDFIRAYWAPLLVLLFIAGYLWRKN